ncbi:cyclic nucleotide-binding protein [Nitzschia inconspicua]|uniref:Cyclic nucleotide-binding protein n=1 Tax=Nitzschia inconspicua TaxID=303405 RepID=A0A9K3PV67_9STRA|nr:cyclic nucleotide-binding protein [Nitzschia inconspicua]
MVSPKTLAQRLFHILHQQGKEVDDRMPSQFFIPRLSLTVDLEDNVLHIWNVLRTKAQVAVDAWLNTFVINSSPEKEWHFRTLFVAEVTVLPFLLAFAVISFWLLNRNTHIHKTKGSTITRKNQRADDSHDGSSEEECDDDDDDDQSTNSCEIANSQQQNRKHDKDRTKNRRSRRHSIQAMLEAYDVENDDDEEGTMFSVDMSAELDELDYDAMDLTSNEKTESASQSEVFFSKEKRNLFRIVREIPILSYFNEEAMQICMDYVEYFDFGDSNDSRKNDRTLWEKDQFDGSLYYIVSGRVNVYFHDFTAGRTDSSGLGENDTGGEPVKVVHEAGTVVTSLLSLIEGMVKRHLQDKNLVDRLPGLPLRQTSAYTDGPTKIIRVPSVCFSKILERFPETVLRVVQTTLNRTQRVTVQTLVRTCGLREELLVPPSKEIKAALRPKRSATWRVVQEYLDKKLSHATFNPVTLSTSEKTTFVKNASTALANVLGIYDASTIEVLQENSSIMVINPDSDSKKRVLLETGSANDCCYFLLKGEVELGIHTPLEGFSPQELRANPNAWAFRRKEVMQPGTMIGESACFTTDVNLFEVRCFGQKTVVLMRIPKDVFSHLMVKHPQSMAISLVSIISVLSPVVHLLTWTTEWLHVEAAEEIAQRGTPCKSLYVVLNGRLRAQEAKRARQWSIGGTGIAAPPEEFGRGKIIGEIEALSGSKWPFDVFAIRQSEVAKVPISTLEAVVRNFPSAGLFLARSVASRVESMNVSKRQRLQTPSGDGLLSTAGQIVPDLSPGHATVQLPNALPSYGLKLATIAVVPLSYNVDLRRFCSTLHRAMCTIAPCKLLNKATVKEGLGEKVWQNRKNPLQELKLTRLLGDMEENNRVVIYQADPKYTFWTRLCIRQADCILLVVDSHRAPERSRLEQTLAWAYEAMDVRIDLVVVGEGEKSSETEEEDDLSCYDDDDMTVSDQLNNWSESRKWIAGHHLVRAPFQRYRLDFRRMCRRISGRAVGLVLGGGGARGLAHLGVIRALIEAGVTVDLVGGTSQGAFCGALFARYPDDYEKVLDANRKMAADMSSVFSKLLDLTLPLASMFTGRGFNRGIRRLLGKLRIQDLVLNFYCVSVDLVTQNAIIHTKGLLWKYVRASMTLAGYLPPIADNGSLLVDGGYLNAIPADIMKHKMGARLVIAVDVMPENKREYFSYGTHLSGWWLLYNSWNPFVATVKVPSMGDISEMLVWVASERHRKSVRLVSDLHLTPPVSDVGTLEYDRFEEIVEKSYEYAKPLVAEFVKKHPWLVSQEMHSNKRKELTQGENHIIDQ